MSLFKNLVRRSLFKLKNKFYASKKERMNFINKNRSIIYTRDEQTAARHTFSCISLQRFYILKILLKIPHIIYLLLYLHLHFENSFKNSTYMFRRFFNSISIN